MSRAGKFGVLGLGLLWMALLGACGTSHVYRPSAAAGFAQEPSVEIDDESIRQAFEARPQLPAAPRVAWYSFDPERAPEIAQMLDEVPEFTEVYQIPSLLVTGQRRFDQPSNPYGAAPPRELSLKKLRLLAAKARCDLLLIFDHGYRVETAPNGWVALNALLIPALFTPFIDEKTSSYMDIYVMDTRNGYLYAQLTAQEESEAQRQTIWSQQGEEDAQRHWGALLESAQGRLGAITRAERSLGGEGAGGAEAPALPAGAPAVGVQ
jgi:hypothetical protein